MIRDILPIDRLIEVVKAGGSVKTGVDVYDRDGTLLLAGDVLVDRVRTLEIISKSGVRRIPLARGGGLFNSSGQKIRSGESALDLDPAAGDPPRAAGLSTDMQTRLKQIHKIRQEAALMFTRARTCLKTALEQIRAEKGQFDVDAVRTQAGEMAAFTLEAGHPAVLAGRDLFSFDDYLYLHAVNVCAMGTAVARRFNEGFSAAVDTALESQPSLARLPGTFSYYLPGDLDDISFALFVFDIGKALVPEALLNKSSRLTREEFALVRRHSYEFGARILEANGLAHPVLSNMVQYHHAPIFEGEKRGYPRTRAAAEIPLYVKICKLVDMYDAMVSRTSYRDAQNQAAASAQLFRTYVKKDTMLQFLLHAFVGCVGLYPPGSIVYLKNGQMAYVLEDKGPVVVPFTDARGQPLNHYPEPFDIRTRNALFQVDADRSIESPRLVFNLLPEYIRKLALPAS